MELVLALTAKMKIIVTQVSCSFVLVEADQPIWHENPDPLDVPLSKPGKFEFEEFLNGNQGVVRWEATNNLRGVLCEARDPLDWRDGIERVVAAMELAFSGGDNAEVVWPPLVL